MRTRTKILIAIAAAMLWFGIEHSRDNKPMRDPELTAQELRQYYDASNDAYFNKSLPMNTVIDYADTNSDSMAFTERLPDGRFHIAFNKKWGNGERYRHLSMLHEQCHIKTWEELDNHGPRWHACMYELDTQGAFRHELIDNAADE